MINRMRVLVTAAAIVVLGSVMLAAAPDAAARGADAVLTELGWVLRGPCGFECYQCSIEDEHAVFEFYMGDAASFHEESCPQPGDCTEHDNGCTQTMLPEDVRRPTVEQVRSFYAALEAAQGDALRRFVDHNDDLVSYNSDRQSLQIKGCDGELVANLPLTFQQARALSD